MGEMTMIAIDLGKNVFQLCAADADGKELWNKKMKPGKAYSLLAELAPLEVVMEACGGAHYASRRVQALGHQASRIHPRRVTPFVVGPHKDDSRDVRGIITAARQPHTIRIAPKSQEQQELQGLLRLHYGMVRQRTSSINRFRSLPRDHGYRIAKGRPRGSRGFPEALEALEAAGAGAVFMSSLRDEVSAITILHERTEALEQTIGEVARSDPMALLLMTIPGIGPLTAVALVAAISDPHTFADARALAAWLGLVPRRFGTGGQVRHGSITKHGDGYLRRNLVQGAKSLIWATPRKGADRNPRCRLERWILARHESLHLNEVAVANRMARCVWAVMCRGESYKADPLGDWSACTARGSLGVTRGEGPPSPSATVPLGTIEGKAGLQKLADRGHGLVDKPSGLPTTPQPRPRQGS